MNDVRQFLGRLGFQHVWAIDFEFLAHPGQKPAVVCMVAKCLLTGAIKRLWRDDLACCPFQGGDDELFVAYYASAEASCFDVLGWPRPRQMLDLFAEFRRLTNGAGIRAEIDRRMAALFDRYAITSDRIIRELAKIGFGNIDDFVVVQDDGSLVVDFGTATREQMASLKSIEIDERMIDGAAPGVRKIKISMSDKRQALMDLAKLARMLPADRHEHSGPGGGPIAFDANVKEEHKIDIEAMAPEEREQLRALLLRAVGSQGKVIDVESEKDQ